MSRESACLKVPKRDAETALTLIGKMGIFDTDLEVRKDADFVYIPISRQPSMSESMVVKEHVPNNELSSCMFARKQRKRRSLPELLENSLPPHLLASLPRGADIVGDIIIIEIPPELVERERVIGEAVLKMNPRARTVLAKAGAVTGIYRLRDLRAIAGEPKTDTIHKENGCTYYVDVSKAYFSPRLSHEHDRVASLVREGETVVDLFAGVGPFAILIAKKHREVKVYAVDVNPDAVEYLKRNIRMNRVDEKVQPILGDARQTIKQRLSGTADRVIMNLPENAIDFVNAACEAIKPEGGTIHFYSFIDTSNTLENMQHRFAEKLEKSGRRVDKILFSRLVRATAPYEWQAVIDAHVE